MTEAPDSTVEVRDAAERQRYEARVDDALAGFADYEIDGDRIDFTHTEIDDAYEGQGVGSSLVREALDDVRRRGGLRVIASCPFVSEWVERHSDYADLLAD